MRDLLLSYRWKIVGYVLTGSGILLVFLYFGYGVHFTLPVFAIFSSYLENKFFVSFPTNVTDDLILLLLISGFALIVFSREKKELANLIILRYKAIGRAFIINTIFLLLSILFIFGGGFIGVLVLNLFSLPIFYLFFFYLLRFKLNKSKRVLTKPK